MAGSRRPKGIALYGTHRHKAAALVERANGSGVTPLHVLVTTMRDLWHRAMAEADPDKRIAKQLEAVEVAVAAAPYCHPRLRTVTMEGNVKVTLEQLVAKSYEHAVVPATIENEADAGDVVH